MVRIKFGLDKKLFLGNLDAKEMGSCYGLRRGYVENFATKKPEDYVIAMENNIV